MGKWADAFQAHIQARDTADTGDTSPGGPPRLFGEVSTVSAVSRLRMNGWRTAGTIFRPCVLSVRSVTPWADTKCRAQAV